MVLASKTLSIYNMLPTNLPTSVVLRDSLQVDRSTAADFYDGDGKEAAGGVAIGDGCFV